PHFAATGGVQASGTLAWRAVTRPTTPSFGEASLISYGRNGNSPARPDECRTLGVSSKLGAVGVALGRRWRARLVLVWHLDLLKHLFLLRPANARTALFLHGIDACRPQSL